MATKKNARKPMAKKAMKKAKGGAQNHYLLKMETVEVPSRPTETLSMNFDKITW